MSHFKFRPLPIPITIEDPLARRGILQTAKMKIIRH